MVGLFASTGAIAADLLPLKHAGCVRDVCAQLLKRS